MKEVFISYSTHDIQRASSIRSLLEQNGITCWMGDKDIQASNAYTEDIVKAIKECRVFVLVFSSYAQASTYVLSEFECAVSSEKRIIPLIIENFRIDEKYIFHFRTRQAIKAYEDWKDSEMKLLDSIKKLLSKRELESQIVENTITSIANDDLRATLVNPEKQTTEKTHTPVQCPYCGCLVLKQSDDLAEMIQSPDGKYTWKEKFNIVMNKFLDKMSLLYGVIAFCTIGFLSSYVASSKNTVYSILFLLLLVTVFSLPVFMIRANIENLAALTSAVKHSKLKYWRFKCAKCEKSFGYLLPEKDNLNDYVVNYLDNSTPKKR